MTRPHVLSWRANVEHVVCNLCGADRPRWLRDRGLFGDTVHMRLCSRCGLVYQTPRPEPADLGGHYSDEYWIRYADRGRVTAERDGEAAAAAHRRERARRRLEYLDSVAALLPGRALEIGCGDGEILLLLRERGWDVLGVEPSRGMAERARERGLDVRPVLFDDVRLQRGAFDLVLHFHVLEHMPDPLDALRRMRALLSERGHMLLETPSLYRARSKPLEDFFRKAHLFVFAPATLKPMLAAAGLRTVARDPDYAHLRWVCAPDEPGPPAFDAGEPSRAARWCRWWNLAFACRKWRRRLGWPG